MAHLLSLYLYVYCSYGISVLFLFPITAAVVVPCGGPKKSPRTSSIVQIIFPFGPLRSACFLLPHVAKFIGSLKRLK